VAQGYSSAEIADRLFLSTSTVNTHQRNLRKKFGLKNRFNLVAFALSNGLVE
jgi:DNA-binding CsgD family transcriptional regulator